MKEKIIEIIGFGMEPERAESKASEVIILFNEMIVKKLKEIKLTASMETFNTVSDLFIKL